MEVSIIPKFEKDDYLYSDIPYKWLCENADNDFQLEQLKQQMKIAAGDLGVRCFVSMFDKYQKSLKRKRDPDTGNATRFEGQEIELYSGEYICDESGVYVPSKLGFTYEVCCHPIMPVRRLVNIDSGEERLEISYKKGNAWRHHIAEKSMLASSNQILQLAAYGIMVNSENAKMLSTYLLKIENLNYNTIQEQRSVGRLGWVQSHGFSPYVDDLVFDGETSFRHIFNAVKSKGSREKWLDAMRKVRAEKGVGRLFLATSFASVLLEPCGLLPFFLHAWGFTESGKTVGLMIAASVWACPKIGEYITTFNSTAVGQEMTASFLNSLPMCLDELQIQSSAGIKDFDKMIYQLTEGVGRTRGAKTGGLQKQNTWKCCIITNGEHPISNANSGGGAINRIIEFECAEKVYSDLKGLCDVMNDNYGFAGREFVEYLQTDGAFDRVSKMQKEFYRELLKSDSTDKQAASASAILTADAIATELIFQDENALTVEDLSKIMMKKSEVNVNVRCLQYIYELVARNPLHFRPNDFGEYRLDVWGKQETDKIFIIKSVFDEQLKNAGYNSTAFLSWAKRNEYILCDNNRRTKNAQVNGNVVPTVCIVKKSEEQLNTFVDVSALDDDLPV